MYFFFFSIFLVILSISAPDFQIFIQENPSVRVAVEHQELSIKLQLKDIPFFNEISAIKLQQLATLFEFRKCNEGIIKKIIKINIYIHIQIFSCLFICFFIIFIFYFCFLFL
jgi:hypothetical protein